MASIPPQLLLFSFSFKSPWLLLVLLAVPAAVGLYLLLDRRRASSAAAWSSPALLENMIGDVPGGLRWVPAAILGVALTLELVLLWFTFNSPWPLLVLLALAAAAALSALQLSRRRARPPSRSTAALPQSRSAGEPGLVRHIPAVIFALGMTLLLVGFARPERKVTEAKNGATVVLMIDDSGSMGANDVKPTRLAAADAAVAAFVKAMPSKYQAALITFSSGIAVKVPPTNDREALIRGLPRKAELQGTAMGTALQEAVVVAERAVGPSKRGAPHPPASILLISDGGSNSGSETPLAAAELALKAGIPVSTVALGTAAGQVHQNVPIVGGKGSTVPVVLQAPVEPATLKTIAKESGGTFFTAHSPAALSQVYKQLGSRLVYGKQYREITVAVTAAALVLILAAAGLSSWWFRRLV